MTRSRELRRAIADLSFKAISSPLEKACRLVVLMVAAPALGATAFGGFQFAATVTGMLAAITGFGLGTWTTRALAGRAEGDDGGSIVAVGLRLRALSVVPFVGLLGIAVLVETAGELRWAMLGFGLAALASSFVDHFASVLRGREEFRTEAIMNTVRAALTTLSALAGLGLARSLEGLAVGVLVGSLASVVAALGLVRHVLRGIATAGPRDAARSAKGVVREAIPLWLAGLFATLYFRSDILFVRYYGGEAEVGSYTAAYRIFEATMILPSAVMAVAFPRLVRARASPQQVASLTLLLFGIGSVVAAALCLADDTMVERLLGPTFVRSAASLRVLAFAVPVMFVTYAVSDFVLARGRERPLVIALAAMLVLNVGLNSVLVPRFGGPGAAWSTLLTELALIAACFGMLGRPIARETAPAS